MHPFVLRPSRAFISKLFLSCRAETLAAKHSLPRSPSSQPLATTNLLSVSMKVTTLGMSRKPLCQWLISLSIMSLRFIRVITCDKTAFIFRAEFRAPLYVHTTSCLSNPPLSRYLGGFHTVVIMNNAAIATERSDQLPGEKWRGAVGGVCRGNGKRFRTRLTAKLNASRVHGNEKRRALGLSLALLFLEAWMIVLQLPTFFNGQYFRRKGTLGTA